MTGAKERLAEAATLLAPGIFDAPTAPIAARAGAEAPCLSGASTTRTRPGRRGIGFVGMAEVAGTMAAARERLEPPIVDTGTGFGNAPNVRRTVRLFERMGANAIQLDDRTSPKRGGTCRERRRSRRARCTAGFERRSMTARARRR
jgi:2-methylisocitrate lyase-like PEP mutase family enzyme